MTEGGRQYEGDVAEQRIAQTAAQNPVELLNLGTYLNAGRIEADYRAAQQAQLSRGQQMRGEQPNPDADYQGYSHEELYTFSQEDNNAAEVDDRGRAANKLGNVLEDVGKAARDAINAEGAAWQGPAAEAAGGWVTASAAWMEDTGQASQLVANQYSSQTDIASRMKNETPPPTGFDADAEMAKVRRQADSGDLFGAVSTYSQISAKQAEAEQKRQEAVQALTRSDQGYLEAASQQPSFSAPPSLSGDSSAGATSASSAGGGSAATGAPSFGGGGLPGGGAGGSSGIPGGGAGAPGPGSSSGVGGAPGPTPGPGGTPPGTPARPGPGLFTPLPGTAPERGDGRRSTTTPRPGANRAGGRVSGGGVLPKSGGGAPPKGGGAAGRVGGPGSGAGAKPGLGEGKGSGAQQPKTAIGGRAAANAGPAARGGGAGPMAAGAGRGKGEDDKERAASELLKNEFLFEQDGEVLTDDAGRVVPPEVIGGTEPEPLQK